MAKKQCENSGTIFTSLFTFHKLSWPLFSLVITHQHSWNIFGVHGFLSLRMKKPLTIFYKLQLFIACLPFQTDCYKPYVILSHVKLFVCLFLFISTISTLIYRSRSASPPYTRRSQSRSPPPRRRSRSPPPPRRDRSRSPRRDRSPYDRDRRGRRWCMRPRHVYRYWVFHDIKQLCSFKLPHVGFCFKIILLA